MSAFRSSSFVHLGHNRSDFLLGAQGGNGLTNCGSENVRDTNIFGRRLIALYIASTHPQIGGTAMLAMIERCLDDD